ncbi:MAG: IPT/TIG domain-containing protein [Bacteroidetes bacterium]|nr:IPT/TIG domain-containing protein [Bacteroidota bacterium]
MKATVLLFTQKPVFRLFQYVTLIMGLLSSSALFAASSGPRNAGTGSNMTGIGTIAWSNPTNIIITGSPYASASVTTNGFTNYLRGSNYGFTIPENATINGIFVTINRQASNSLNLTDNVVRLVKAGVVTGTNFATATNWSTTMTVANYGGPTNTWGTTWTAAEINNSGFGVVLSVDNSSITQLRTAIIDYMQITVYYTTNPPTITGFTPTSGCPGGGTSVVISGTNFLGATSVAFYNGQAASFTVNTATQITAIMPAGTTDGTISVTTPEGSASSSGIFTVNSGPAAPTGSPSQSFCSNPSPSVASLSATGSNIQWYSASSGGTPLALSTVLVNGNHYYATQTVSGCESTSRLDVTVSAATAPSAGNLVASASALCTGNGAVVTVSSTTLAAGNYTVTYNVSGTNTIASTTATMSFTAGSPGSGTFTTSALNNAGTGNVVNITSIAFTSTPGCTSNVTASMAVIALRGTATTASGTTSVTIAKPAGVVAGDVMIANIAHVLNVSGTATAATSAGWTLVSGSSLGGSVRRYGTVLYKIATSSEPANYIFITTSGLSAAGSVIAFSGVDISGTTPFDVVPGSISASGSSTSTSLTATSLTTVSANTAVVMLGQGIGTSTAGSNFSAWATATAPGVLTEICDFGPTGAGTAFVGSAWAFLPVAGSTGAGSATVIPSGNGGLLLALRPAVLVSPSTAAFTTKLTPAAPTGSASQTFCSSSGPTIASLTPAGSGILWYATSSGGSSLATSASLTNGSHYYASQTESGCESVTRLDVTVTVETAPAASVFSASAATTCTGNGSIVTVTSSTLVTGNYVVTYDVSPCIYSRKSRYGNLYNHSSEHCRCKQCSAYLRHCF